jgi:glucosamine-6-phosphate deaminase
MRIVVCDSREQAADRVAGEILDSLDQKPDLVLGLATGTSPIPVYERLIEAHDRGDADFSRVRTFNLDEYIGLERAHPQSYYAFMRKHLFSQINIPAANAHFPPTEGPGLEAKCRAFDRRIEEAGGVDIQLLGIGRNGHIGFNEPTSSFFSQTRIVSLTEKTLQDNARYFTSGKPQPTLAVTAGIGTILGSRRIFLQAFGRLKADAIKRTVEGPVSSFCPGSALQLHSDVTIFVDADAASDLTMAIYYRRAEADRQKLRDNGVL